MAHLATVGSHAINGVAALHSELLKASVLKDFYELWPERFGNVTNGVTPRRFLALSNPGLRELLDEHHRRRLADRPRPAARAGGLRRGPGVPAAAGERSSAPTRARLAEFVHSTTGIELDPTWMFDIQVKRIHEYKRQHLNVLHIITLYNRLKQNPGFAIAPRAFIFGGKAAPGYFMAKRIIKLITAVGATVNDDPDVNRFHEGGVRAELQRAERASDLPGRQPVRADLDRRQGSLGHRQHEVHDERRADHRHPRRRQRRDPRRGRPGELLPVRADRRRGRADQGRGLPAGELHRARSENWPRCSN